MKPTLLSIVMLAIFCQTDAQVIYVQQGGSGDGSSWSMATNSVSEALQAATPGTQVWVAAGVYPTTVTTDRNISFVIPRGVEVYGGFNGTEASIKERNIDANVSILSGEIGASGPSDNAYNVVLLPEADGHTILDGFTISGGNANGETPEGDRLRCGGGMYIKGGSFDSRPVIRRCTFTGNMGRDGAAVYINGRGENICSPQFIACSFSGNEAGLDGGAIYNDGRMNGKSNPTLTNCIFYRNVGTYGGAICNATETGVCNLTLDNCTFIENVALLRGGAVFSLNGNERCYLEMSDCSFTNNYPDDKNMVFTSNAARSNVYKVQKTEP